VIVQALALVLFAHDSGIGRTKHRLRAVDVFFWVALLSCY